jgi:hypothetical protein
MKRAFPLVLAGRPAPRGRCTRSSAVTLASSRSTSTSTGAPTPGRTATSSMQPLSGSAVTSPPPRTFHLRDGARPGVHLPRHCLTEGAARTRRSRGQPGPSPPLWRLLKDRRVTAYVCGRTHHPSAKKVESVWQLETGHERGKGGKGAPTTFAKITVRHGDPGTSTTGPTPGASATRSRCPARSSRSSAAATRPHRL